jgi:DNA-binding MarR family transcriptional regulator
MSSISTISRETPVEFVRRNGPTLTSEIGFRFGLRVQDALRTMKTLERAGSVTSRRVAYAQGAGLEWTCPPDRH